MKYVFLILVMACCLSSCQSKNRSTIHRGNNAVVSDSVGGEAYEQSVQAALNAKN